MAEEFFVEKSDAGMRIDRFLVARYPRMTRGEVARMVRGGAVVVDGKTVKPSLMMRGGERVCVEDVAPLQECVMPNPLLSVDIVEDTDDFVVVNKPRGVRVHPDHREKTATLVNALVARYPQIARVGEDPMRPGIVHRLDKDTTGLLVVAKTLRAFTELKSAFQRRAVRKIYRALVWGAPKEEEGMIDAPIARATSYTKQKIAVGAYTGDAKQAQTAYRVVERFRRADDTDVSLVELRPRTGRMHQIRVHMAHIGHPLLGDARYCRKTQRRRCVPLPPSCDPSTFYLHAAELAFVFDGKDYAFHAPDPERFARAVAFLRGENK